MIRKFNYISGLVLSLTLASCAYDNYDPPKSSLKGRIVYNGEAINVASGDVVIRLVEPGYARVNPIDVAVAQDGSYSALLFDAPYKLYIPNGIGPYRPILNAESGSDTIPVTVQGSKVLDIEVMPYYMVRNAAFTATGRKITASCKVEKIITDANARDIVKVTLFISKSLFADTKTNFATQATNGGDIVDMNNVSLSVEVPPVPLNQSQNYVFARIGVQIDGVGALLYSPVQKVQFQ